MSGNQPDIASSEQERKRFFKLLVKQGTPKTEAFRRSFPTTVHEIERECKDKKAAAHRISNRASRMAKTLGVASPKKAKKTAKPPTAAETAAEDKETIREGFKAASVEELRKFMEELAGPVSTVEGQIKKLHYWLGLFLYKAEVAEVNNDTKSVITFMERAEKILVLLDPQRYRRGQAEKEDEDDTQFYAEIRDIMKQNHKPHVKKTGNA